MIKWHVGDCREIMKKIPKDSIDMIFTDPPFGISKKRKNRKRNLFSGYQENKGAWDEVVPASEWISLAIDRLKDGGIFACFGVFGSLVPIYLECKRLDLRFQTHITWHKTNPAPCVHRRGLTLANEFILVFSKGSHWYFDYKRSKKQNHGKQQHNHIDCPAVRRVDGRTRKPIQLTSRYIELWCRRNGIVLDPFAGTGSLLEAAEFVHRNSIGIEIKP